MEAVVANGRPIPTMAAGIERVVALSVLPSSARHGRRSWAPGPQPEQAAGMHSNCGFQGALIHPTYRQVDGVIAEV